MITRIAVLGPSDFIERLKQMESELPNIMLDYYIYNNPKEAIELIPCINPCDALFFSGSLPYIYAEKARERLPIPSYYLKQDATALSTTLLSICFSRTLPISKLSIDLIEPKSIRHVLEDIEKTDEYPLMMKINPAFDLQEVVSFHTNLQKSKITSLAVTSIHAVYQELQENNLAVIRMIDPKSSIIKGIEDTQSMALLAKSQSAKIAVGFVKTDEAEAKLQKLLDEISNTIQATVSKEDDNLYLLYSTQGDVQSAFTSNSIATWLEKTSSPLRIAFGFGKTVVEATQNAKEALPFVTDNTAYILTDQKELLGPFPNQQKKIRLKTTDPKLAQLARETTLSPGNISKIIQFSLSRTSVEFTAYDLEVYLQVSRRSTERILKKLVDHGYARITGEEMTYQQGRPRSIYILNFPTYF